MHRPASQGQSSPWQRVGAALLACAAVACGSSATNELAVTGAWSRPTAADARAARDSTPTGLGVVYLTIENATAASERLLSVHADVCARAELHRTVVEGERARMAPVEGGLTIPANEIVEMKPGGLHIMLHELRRHLVAGDTFELELRFEAAGRVLAAVDVREL